MASIELLAERIMKDAVKNHASDIHIIPRQNDTLIQLRIANKLLPRLYLPLEECDRLISHLKFKAQMDIGEKRRPQSGAFSLRMDGQNIGVRLSTLPSNNHESLVIRILPQQEQIPYFQISLFPHMTRKLMALLKHAHGLVIFTGPTSREVKDNTNINGKAKKKLVRDSVLSFFILISLNDCIIVTDY